MAEATAGNGNGQKLEKAAESALLQLASRWLVVIGFPAMFGLSVWFGSQFVERMDRAIDEMRLEFKANDTRVDGIDLRLTGAERDIQYLKERN